ncbi:MAG: sugar-transfer associated ATP-grasp domain-containing protein [Bacillota bacterium]|nr:sugar-transfer associated ATP-grasp domain-containing protein [Bacillota bacterium]
MSTVGKLGYLNIIVSDVERKPFAKIVTELARCTVQSRRLPAHYVTSFLYREGSGDWHNYLDRRTMDRIWSSPRLHHPLGTKILQNKLFFDRYYRNTGVKLPRTLGYCSNSYAFVGDKRWPLAELPQIMENLLMQSNQGSVFIKPLDGINGRQCRRFDWEDLNYVDVHNLRRELMHGSYVFQETLTQHPSLSSIYSRSINTLRLDTFVRNDGSISIISGLMRFGMHGREVDNGGCFIGVDLESGALAKRALCFMHLGGGVYDAHPNTSYKFAGFEVPFFTEAKATVTKAARLIPSRLVGWDVAITPTGPVLIEGNHNYHLGMSDTANQGYRNNPRFQEVLRLI